MSFLSRLYNLGKGLVIAGRSDRSDAEAALERELATPSAPRNLGTRPDNRVPEPPAAAPEKPVDPLNRPPVRRTL